MSTKQGKLADGACPTMVCIYQVDSESETELWIQVKELLFDDAYLLKVIDDKKSWFTRREVLHLIYHEYFFIARSLGRQLNTSQFFQPVAPQTLGLVAAANHCVLSEYTTGMKDTLMSSQDEYRCKFCPSTVIDCITAEATALIDYTLVGTFIPPMELLHYDRHSLIPVGGGPTRLALRYFIQHTIHLVQSAHLL